jgi:hypothetical protein
MTHQSTELNSIVSGEFQDIPNGNCRWLSWSNRVVRCRKRRHLQKLLESGRREHDEIVILVVARITQPVRDVTRGDERIAYAENKDLVSDDDLQFSGEDIIRLILTRMRMTRHTHPRRETQFQEAVFSSGICAP